MVLGCVNRTVLGTKLLLMAVLASLVDWIYQFKSLTEGTALPFESEWVLYPAFGSLPAPTTQPLPPPIDSIRDITVTEKTVSKTSSI